MKRSFPRHIIRGRAVAQHPIGNYCGPAVPMKYEIDADLVVVSVANIPRPHRWTKAYRRAESYLWRCLMK